MFAPRAGHVNVKGGEPANAVAVTVPAPEEQISGVELAPTADETPVIHEVSDAAPIAPEQPFPLTLK